MASKIINHPALHRSFGEPVLLMLPMYREQMRRNPLQCARGNLDIVDPTATATALGHLTANDDRPVSGSPKFIEQYRELRTWKECERTLNLEATVSGANQVRMRALPAEELEGFDEQRFAGAGLSSKRRKTRSELELDGVDDAETTYRESFEHCGILARTSFQVHRPPSVSPRYNGTQNPTRGGTTCHTHPRL
jgi:hypothetical protein